MRFRYAMGVLIANLYRLLRVFPNSDPIMGFVLPASKLEWWKAPAFAFVTMFVFDIFTSGIGPWTYTTSFTYAGIALALHFLLKNKESSLRLFLASGAGGVIVFDFITGPIATSIIFSQDFLVTLLLQVPFTVMHLVSATFYILIITPFLDKRIMEEVTQILSTVKNAVLYKRLDV